MSICPAVFKINFKSHNFLKVITFFTVLVEEGSFCVFCQLQNTTVCQILCSQLSNCWRPLLETTWKHHWHQTHFTCMHYSHSLQVAQKYWCIHYLYRHTIIIVDMLGMNIGWNDIASLPSKGWGNCGDIPQGCDLLCLQTAHNDALMIMVPYLYDPFPTQSA